jgi:uncharacterized protein YndB with AHSA1/START domain
MFESEVSAPAGAKHFVITRHFAAPRQLVYRCYTTPEHMVHFWGPRGSTLTVCDIDLRVGGVWRVRWTYPDGRSWGYSSVYTGIQPDTQLDYRDAPYDWAGGIDGLAEPEMLSTIALSGGDRATTVAVTVHWRTVEARDMAIKQGFAGMVNVGHERLEQYIDTLDKEA